MLHSLYTDAVFTQISNGAAAGTTEVDSSILDMSGFDSVIFGALLGTVTSGSVVTLTAQQNSANSTSGMAAITDAPGVNNAASSFTAGASSSNVMMLTDVFRPIQRYVRAAFVPTTQNAQLLGMFAIQYNSRNLPVTQSASVAAGSFVAAQ